MENKDYDLVIIGAGPAGLTAGIYASRSNMKTLIIERSAPGGRMLNSHKVDNFPGMPEISGADIAKNFYDHAVQLGVEFEFTEVNKIIDIDKTTKIINTLNKKSFKTKAIIIATGTQPRRIDVKNYDKFFGRGLSTCVICDGAFFKNKDIAIIGGGNSAVEESLFIAGTVNKINIINILPEFDAFPSIIESFRKYKNIEEFHNSKVISINGKDNIESITIRNLITQKETEIPLSGVFTYVGSIPSSNFLKGDKTILNENNFINADFETNTTLYPGIFSAGDIVNKKFKQIATAVSDGAKAALSAKKYIDEINGRN